MKLVQVPHLPGLRVSDILKFAKSKVDIEEYLPNFKNDDKFPDRAWVWNIGKAVSVMLNTVNTLIPLDFKSFIMRVVRENDKIQIGKRKQEIDVIPEFAKLFKTSDTFSSKNLCIMLHRV